MTRKYIPSTAEEPYCCVLHNKSVILTNVNVFCVGHNTVWPWGKVETFLPLL